MLRVRVGASRGLRWGILTLATTFVLVTVGSDAADARSRRHTSHKYSAQQKRHSARSSYEPPYAAIVVDANSGRELHATNADNQRHPASITKIMTLYLLFEQLEAGKFKLDSRLPVSAHAAAQAPSKLGLKPGQTIQIDDAIKAVVTKSANDIAVVIAEAVAGNEEEFAKLMTRKARALGMAQTVYVNASGLPDDDQVTTARDQALLGRAIQDRFPAYYRYFSTASFSYNGHAIRNHNNLLGRVAGVDGIKTGYVHASGFNLVASVRRGNRHLVAVVMGGSSARSRDARMRDLIEEYVGQGATMRTAAKIVETPTAQAQAKPALVVGAPLVRPESARPEAPANGSVVAARTAPATAAAVTATRPVPGSTEPIAAIRVKTLAVRASTANQNATIDALSVAAPASTQAPAHVITPAQFHTASATSTPVPATAVPAPAVTAPAAPAPAAVASAPATASVNPAVANEQAAPQVTHSTARMAPRGSWIVQIGAFPDEGEARERLQSAQNLAKGILGRVDVATEPVTKGRETLYRARFVGLDESSAEAACRYFKRNKIDCFAIRN
ncbi:MAG TPA: D-alanyl-D-alanine carboxypeptidase [Xanthobacteraceae bacterium]|nr:D-alanyl-D-alanine carboxypeptidase [Xanthobacteraceae bacterium]